jgi:hypothetical protein
VRSVHGDAGAGLYRLPVWVTTSRIGEGGLIGLLCSQRAHDQNVLPQCAQWETNSGLSPGEDTSKLGWTIGDTGHSEYAAPPPRYAGIEGNIETSLG